MVSLVSLLTEWTPGPCSHTSFCITSLRIKGNLSVYMNLSGYQGNLMH